MALTLKILRDIKRKADLKGGGRLILPAHIPILGLYEDVSICEPNKPWHVVAINHHYSEEQFCSVYFYFENRLAAKKALNLIGKNLNGGQGNLILDDVAFIEVENYDESLLFQHTVTHFDVLNNKKQKITNPFRREYA